MQVIIPDTAQDFERYYELRWRILRAPWGQPRGSERDEWETQSHHVMVCDIDRLPVGVGRAHMNSNDEAQLRFMAVAEHLRRRGIGKMILQALEQHAAQERARVIVLNARSEEIGFYLRFGYRDVGEAPTLFGSIAHRHMRKTLTSMHN